ncbi:MAG: DUF996 domain-containing protein [Candidatus Altarchaeaceae archaeon]
MNNLEKAKIYGGFGTIIALIGTFVPYIDIILMLIGMILVLLATKFISNDSGNKKIFENCIISLIFFVIMLALINLMGFMFFNNLYSLVDSDSYISFSENLSESTIIDMSTKLVIIWIVLWIFLIIIAYFLRKSFIEIYNYTKVDLFKITGLMYLIGGISTILIIGTLIWLIAAILQIVAFFSLPKEIKKQNFEERWNLQ